MSASGKYELAHSTLKSRLAVGVSEVSNLMRSCRSPTGRDLLGSSALWKALHNAEDF
jgi:hypothetical protein